MRATSVDLVDLVKKYFLLGYLYYEILQYLASFNGITLSLRQLNRILRTLGLFRRHHHISPNITRQAVQEELKGSSSEFGYRLRHQKLRSKGLNTDRESVRIALKCLDPDGVKSRTSHRFRRCIYVSPGPNFTWHIDGYDKLKPFGLAIHGHIDSYDKLKPFGLAIHGHIDSYDKLKPFGLAIHRHIDSYDKLKPFGLAIHGHIDSYDKLKTFGLAIHGALDGYSRKSF